MSGSNLCLFLLLFFVLSCKSDDPMAAPPPFWPLHLIDNKTGGDLLGGYKRISAGDTVYVLPDTLRICYSLQGRFLLQTASVGLICSYNPQGRYLETSHDNTYEGLPFKGFTLFDNRPEGMLFTLYGLIEQKSAFPITDTIKGSYRKIY